MRRRQGLMTWLRKLIGLVCQIPAIISLSLPLRRVSGARLFLNGRFLNPGVIVWANPLDIVPKNVAGALVPPGHRYVIPRRINWEKQDGDQIPQSLIHQTMRQLLIEGRRPDETVQYRDMMRRIQAWQAAGMKGKPQGVWWCRSENDVQQYFAILVNACTDIEQNGYKTQEQLKQVRPAHVDRRKHLDEIGVVIGERGRLYHAKNGTHRLLIAQHYRIPKVPVLVIAVAEEWAEKHLQSRFGSLAALMQAGIDAGEAENWSSHLRADS